MLSPYDRCEVMVSYQDLPVREKYKDKTMIGQEVILLALSDVSLFLTDDAEVNGRRERRRTWITAVRLQHRSDQRPAERRWTSDVQ